MSRQSRERVGLHAKNVKGRKGRCRPGEAGGSAEKACPQEWGHGSLEGYATGRQKKAPRQDGVEHRVSNSPSRRMTDRYDASTCRAQKQCNRKTCNRRIEFAYFRSRRASATLP